jgi:hypothetical protein
MATISACALCDLKLPILHDTVHESDKRLTVQSRRHYPPHGMVYAEDKVKAKSFRGGLAAAVTANSPYSITERRAWS